METAAALRILSTTLKELCASPTALSLTKNLFSTRAVDDGVLELTAEELQGTFMLCAATLSRVDPGEDAQKLCASAGLRASTLTPVINAQGFTFASVHVFDFEICFMWIPATESQPFALLEARKGEVRVRFRNSDSRCEFRVDVQRME